MFLCSSMSAICLCGMPAHALSLGLLLRTRRALEAGRAPTCCRAATAAESRWLLGSSSTSRLLGTRQKTARATRAFSPPERSPTFWAASQAAAAAVPRQARPQHSAQARRQRRMQARWQHGPSRHTARGTRGGWLVGSTRRGLRQPARGRLIGGLGASLRCSFLFFTLKRVQPRLRAGAGHLKTPSGGAHLAQGHGAPQAEGPQHPPARLVGDQRIVLPRRVHHHLGVTERPRARKKNKRERESAECFLT